MTADLRALMLCVQRSASQEIGLLQPAAAADSALMILPCAVEELGEAAAREEARQRLENREVQALILSRFTLAWGEELVRQAHGLGIATLFHIDDDLLAVPETIGAPKARRYNDPAYQQRLRRLLGQVDLVLTSTDPLAARLREEMPLLRLHSLGFHRCHTGASNAAMPAPQPVIGYMGSGSHQRDQHLVVPALNCLLRRYPTLRFETFGLPLPAELAAGFGDRTRSIPRCSSYTEFQQRLAGLGWWVGLAPLEANRFNACKSDVKWVEYSEAGIAMVASAFGPYAPLGAAGLARTCAGADDWEEAIETLLLHRGVREQQLQRSLTLLARRRSAGRMAQQLGEAIRQALLRRAAERTGAGPSRPGRSASPSGR